MLNGGRKLNHLHSVIGILICVHVLSVIRPSIEYGSAVLDCNKNQASSLEDIILGGAKTIHGCSCNDHEAVRGDMGLDSLSSRRKVKPRRGRQRKL